MEPLTSIRLHRMEVQRRMVRVFLEAIDGCPYALVFARRERRDGIKERLSQRHLDSWYRGPSHFATDTM